jgi:RsiW-degrading membrane proteinase PrsW (M82 family)
VSLAPSPARTDEGRLVRVGRRWGWAAVLFIGLLLFWLIHSALISTQNPNLVPALIFFGAALVPGAFVVFVAGRRLDFGVGMGVVSATALAGGAIGVTTAGVLEYRTLLLLGVMPMIAVGVIEEAAKLVVPTLVLLFLRDRHPGDGLLVGVASGAGFAVFETMGYAFVELIGSGGNLTAVDHLLAVRGLLSPAAHMAWTGLTAAALWSAAAQKWRGRAVTTLVLVYAVAVGLHAAWDSYDSDMSYIILAVVSLSLLMFTTRRSARSAVTGSTGRQRRQADRLPH